MKFSPDIIDALVIQLRQALEGAENIPKSVMESAQQFTDKLDSWSEDMKAGRETE
jgi:hypothetical protein